METEVETENKIISEKNNHNEVVLKRIVLDNSVHKAWDVARLEWVLDSIEFAPAHRKFSCICTHNPIAELCFIKNSINGRELLVGNSCIKKHEEK